MNFQNQKGKINQDFFCTLENEYFDFFLFKTYLTHKTKPYSSIETHVV